MQIIVDELLAHYELNGNGKLIVLLHGWGDASSTFSHLQKNLADRYQILSINLPGFGGSQAPLQAWGLDEYATFVAAMLRKLDLTAYALLGHSNGGAIIIRGVAQGILKTNKIILLASAGIRGEHNARKQVIQFGVKSGKLLSAPLPNGLKRKLRQKTYAAVGSDLLVVEGLEETFKKVVSQDIRADAANISVPTLLIYGDQDQSTPDSHGEILHKAMHDSKLFIIAGAGHFIHQEHPEEVEQLIEEFLS
jgi:pimeloyl-ACP methyl ester carboxylesterase